MLNGLMLCLGALRDLMRSQRLADSAPCLMPQIKQALALLRRLLKVRAANVDSVSHLVFSNRGDALLSSL